MNTQPLQSRIREMLDLQAEVNRKVTGDGWKSLGKESMSVDYSMAAVAELMEYTESGLPWKWWAKTFKRDWQNAKMELVDTLHFLLSEDLVRSHPTSGSEFDIVAGRVAADYSRAKTQLDLAMKEFGGDESLLVNFIASIGDEVPGLSMFTCKNLVKSIIHSLTDPEMQLDWRGFFSLCILNDLDLDPMYTLYISKNVLNKFRAENGYKTGSYIKKWELNVNEPQEDNYHLQQWLSTQESSISAEDIFNFLSTTYSQVKKANANATK